MRLTGFTLYLLVAPFVMGALGVGTGYLAARLIGKGWAWWLTPLFVLAWLAVGYLPVSQWD